jgi:hypothetical protein
MVGPLEYVQRAPGVSKYLDHSWAVQVEPFHCQVVDWVQISSNNTSKTTAKLARSFRSLITRWPALVSAAVSNLHIQA